MPAPVDEVGELRGARVGFAVAARDDGGGVACLGAVTGWQPVGTAGKYEVAHVDLFRSFVGTTPACETSQHEATSAGAFGVTVWGTDYYASYGYPAGGNIGTINDVVVPPVPR